MKGKISFLGIVFMLLVHLLFSQGRQLNWMADGSTYTKIKDGNIVKIDPKTEAETLFIKKEQLTVNGKVLKTDSYMLSNDNTKLLLFVNTQKVWRYNTKGDYWILDLPTNKLTQIGKGRPAQSLEGLVSGSRILPAGFGASFSFTQSTMESSVRRLLIGRGSPSPTLGTSLIRRSIRSTTVAVELD